MKNLNWGGNLCPLATAVVKPLTKVEGLQGIRSEMCAFTCATHTGNSSRIEYGKERVQGSGQGCSRWTEKPGVLGSSSLVHQSCGYLHIFFCFLDISTSHISHRCLEWPPGGPTGWYEGQTFKRYNEWPPSPKASRCSLATQQTPLWCVKLWTLPLRALQR